MEGKNTGAPAAPIAKETKRNMDEGVGEWNLWLKGPGGHWYDGVEHTQGQGPRVSGRRSTCTVTRR